MIIFLVSLFVLVPLLIEARLSAAHDRLLRAAGAREPADDVYAAMRVAYPAAFLIMLAEGFARHVRTGPLTIAGLAVFCAAKGLKYWAISTLGVRWTFRVLVPPGSVPSASGPYRSVAHPNYLAVAGELSGVAIALHAMVTGPIAVGGFVFLMWRRIGVEERELHRLQG